MLYNPQVLRAVVNLLRAQGTYFFSQRTGSTDIDTLALARMRQEVVESAATDLEHEIAGIEILFDIADRETAISAQTIAQLQRKIREQAKRAMRERTIQDILLITAPPPHRCKTVELRAPRMPKAPPLPKRFPVQRRRRRSRLSALFERRR